MAIKIKDSFIKEDIVDEKGNKIGEIKFNPNDSRIMQKMAEIVNNLYAYLEELKSLGDIPEIPENKLESLEEFEEMSETFKTIGKAYDIEEKAADSSINGLSEIFGKETVELFTGGTKDVLTLMPLIDYVEPYIKKARNQKVNKYIKKKQNDVME